MSSWQPPFWHHFWWDFSEQQTIRRSRCSVRFLFFQFHNFHILFVHCSFLGLILLSFTCPGSLTFLRTAQHAKIGLGWRHFGNHLVDANIWLSNCVVFSTFIQVRTWKTRCYRVIATSGTRSKRSKPRNTKGWEEGEGISGPCRSTRRSDPQAGRLAPADPKNNISVQKSTVLGTAGPSSSQASGGGPEGEG